jgi:hypothetical protein
MKFKSRFIDPEVRPATGQQALKIHLQPSGSQCNDFANKLALLLPFADENNSFD